MYHNSLIPRKFVNFIITEVNTIFCTGIVQQLREIVHKELLECQADEQKINKVLASFGVVENSLCNFTTEYKCFSFFKNSGTYVPPIDYIIGSRNIFKQNRDNTTLIPKKVIGKMMPITKVFQILFEKPDVFEATISYIKKN